ncbi:cell division protein FtsZ [Salinibacter sp.]|jgi:cell division protein FtsZ|uniref:cell division protein FtsZ n=1 Tax=Salinibacter sp. TaxID=2065818 RepID=UPI0021E8A06C|nr:cell division protein FtsZ [Salinibacter sp.]
MDQDFSSKFSFDDAANEEAKICVVGVGGGGGNAINNMVQKGIHGSVEFIAVNTDSQALSENRAPQKIQAGQDLTSGLGAGARPSVGAEAIEESSEEIRQALDGYDMAFITAGMGGGTGTGGAPVVAAIARSLDILTVAIVTKPFDCEGSRRMNTAQEGIELLRENVDTLIVIPNERLLDIADPDTSLIEAFEKADEVLYNATRGISDLITVHGLINLDFADVQTTMKDGGTALMGSATATGENRSEKAAVQAISSPLLDGLSIAGATNVLVNITSGPSLGIREATQATSVIQKEAGEDVEVIFGTVIEEDIEDKLRVTVIATGFDRDEEPADAGDDGRRTVPLEDQNEDDDPADYKGETNLRQLDTPAYERRNAPLRSEPSEDEPTDETGEESGDDAPNIRRLEADDLNERTDRDERSRSDEETDDDTDTPAFLRKMMD